MLSDTRATIKVFSSRWRRVSELRISDGRSGTDRGTRWRPRPRPERHRGRYGGRTTARTFSPIDSPSPQSTAQSGWGLDGSVATTQRATIYHQRRSAGQGPFIEHRKVLIT